MKTYRIRYEGVVAIEAETTEDARVKFYEGDDGVFYQATEIVDIELLKTVEATCMYDHDHGDGSECEWHD